MRPQDFAAPRFVALRTPLLPFDVLTAWAEGFACATALDDVDAHARDLDAAAARLRAWCDDPVVREAIFLASPALLRRAEEAGDDPGVRAALAKYLSRMASRCTPFGLFAGTSVGSIASTTRLELAARDDARRHTRLDTEVVDGLVQRLVADPDVRARIRFVRNSSLAEVGGALHYAEARTEATGRRYVLAEVEVHDPLRRGLDAARTPSTLDAIARAVADDEVPFDAARGFVDQLVDAQLLLPTLGPVVTGRGALEELIDELESAAAAPEALTNLRAIRDDLARLDARGVGAPIATYDHLRERLAPWLDVDPARFVQVDLVRTATHVEVDAKLADELLRAVLALVGLFGHGFRDRLEDFRRAFEARYEERTMPLLEVLDEEIGIGFETSHAPAADPSPLLAGLPFPPLEEIEQVPWGSRGRFLLNLFTEAIASGDDEVVLDRRTITRLGEGVTATLPDAFHVMATVLEGDGPRAILDSAGGPSGARLIGRFCHSDPDLEARTREHLADEEALHPDVRTFEVVHLPEGRTGNILARPVLRDLELEYLGHSGAEPSRRLSVDDLTVTVSRGRVVLRSRALDCEVRPRITTAHDTRHRSLPLYRFLSALQAEGHLDGILWTWGPLANAPRLPRVRWGNVILARAQWRLDTEEIEALRAEGHDGFRRVQQWRARRAIPRWIGLTDNDNVLTVDLDNPLLVAAFLDALRGRPEAVVQEVFCGARPDTVRGPEGRFTNEVLIPFVRRADRVVTRRPVHAMDDDVPTVFAPGSEWMSAKLYAGTSTGDALLTDVLAPLTRALRERGVVDRWFFLRFGDPDWHLRVRWHGDPARLAAEALPALHEALAPWFADRRVHRLQLDTYQREVRRYGGPQSIEPIESIFDADSDFVVDVLAAAQGDEGLDARWRAAALAMDRTCDDAGLDLDTRHRLFDDLATMYGEEFEIDGAFRKSLRDRYRVERTAFESVLQGDPPRLRARSEATAPAWTRLRALDADGELLVSFGEIVASVLHMHANRMLRGAQRAHEVVLYRFLEKASASRRARRR